jgi:hypothetical protein
MKKKMKNNSASIIVVVFLSLFVIASSFSTPWPTDQSLMAETSTQTTPSGTTTTTNSPVSDPSIVIIRELGSTFGPLSVLVFYLWYHETKRMPAKDKLVTDARLDFQNEMRLEREAHQKVVDSLVDQLRKHVDVIMHVVQKCPGASPEAS